MKIKRFALLLPTALSLSAAIFLYLNRPTEPNKTELDLYFRAVAAYEQADFEVCREISAALIKGNPSFHQAVLLYAKAQFFSGNYEEAETRLIKLLRRKENYYEAEIWLLRCHIQLENIEAAKTFGENLLSRSPEDPRVLAVLASISLVENDYQRAIEYYTRSTLFEEELAINRIELAKIYSSLLNPEEAYNQLGEGFCAAFRGQPA